MRNSVDVDLLIIGQGLAGSALAMTALSRGLRVFVVDEPAGNRSSVIAAGLFNPVTGRKMSKTWKADALFPYLHEFYSSVEQLTGRRFFFPMPIYRAFSGIEEQNEWMGRSVEPGYLPFVKSVVSSPSFEDRVNDQYGGLNLKQSGYLDTREYLVAVRDYLTERNSYAEARFGPEKLEVGESSGIYRDDKLAVKAQRIVFCQGIGNSENPWFGNVPIRPLKGEFLTIQCEWENDVILNRGVYVVPDTRTGGWRVGATFTRGDHSHEPTSSARQELTRKLEDLIRIPYSVTGQQWGFRPTTPDRRPIVGAHSRHKILVIFNGLGTKGVSLAPYFSRELIQWIEGDGRICDEVDVSRF